MKQFKKIFKFNLRNIKKNYFSGRYDQMEFNNQKEYKIYLKKGVIKEEGKRLNLDDKKLKELSRKIEVSKKLYRVQYSRSSGAGGQHVNTTDSKATIFVDINSTTLLSDKIKEKIKKNYSSYLSQ